VRQKGGKMEKSILLQEATLQKNTKSGVSRNIRKATQIQKSNNYKLNPPPLFYGGVQYGGMLKETEVSVVKVCRKCGQKFSEDSRCHRCPYCGDTLTIIYVRKERGGKRV